MTTVASKIISEVYNVPAEDYDFQLMYMPMNTQPFHNDFFWEVLGTMISFVLYAMYKLSELMVDTIKDLVYEPVIQ